MAGTHQLLCGLPEALPTCVCVTAFCKSRNMGRYDRGQRVFRSDRKDGKLSWIEVDRDAITLQKI